MKNNVVHTGTMTTTSAGLVGPCLPAGEEHHDPGAGDRQAITSEPFIRATLKTKRTPPSSPWDVLRLGKARMNLPPGGNWLWRMKPGAAQQTGEMLGKWAEKRGGWGAGRTDLGKMNLAEDVARFNYLEKYI